MARASRRSNAAQASPSRPPRSRKAKDEPEPATPMTELDDDENNGNDDDEDEDEPGPSRRGSQRKPKPVKRRVKAESPDSEEEPSAKASQRRRSGKQVSYREVPVEEVPVEESSDDEDDEDDEEEEDDESVVATPVRRGRGRPPKDKDGGDKSYKREPGTGGRGGFSIKGAAAAAARARWDKVRRERAERGEDPDTPKVRSSQPIKKDPRGALENVIKGQVYTIKGVEYTAGEDELILPENEKGNTKVDAEGRLLGGREYKLVTFTSASRGNPNRVYALTIDAARACGYTDSLAFLRRCPQIVKLSCNPDEREMLINVGRITGNLKHRAVTMVAMHNVFKLMGARLVKNGKWVDDDYDEERALVDCEANEWTPHGPVLDSELAVNQYPSAGGPGRPPTNAGMLADAMATKSALGSWSNVGGFTTQFGGNGVDPWSDYHAKRGKLRQLGVTEEDWILRTAEDSRRIDETLRVYRGERLASLEGEDALRGWVYVTEQRSAGEIKVAEKEESKHPLANEVTFEPPSEPLTPAPLENPTSEALGEINNMSEDHKTPGGKIVIETAEETAHGRLKMDKWVPGTVYAAYEPHTQLPHVPLRTQPTRGHEDRLSFQPWIGLNGSARPLNLPSFSSVEVVFDPSAPEDESAAFLAFGDGIRGPDAVSKRRSMIEEAEAWEQSSRAKRRRGTTAAEASGASGPSISATPGP